MSRDLSAVILGGSIVLGLVGLVMVGMSWRRRRAESRADQERARRAAGMN